ncbi:MAG TPA: YCF48-related protein [Myxococcota bacterium]|nr:YCF48-related protein [Myxococcota bacterium]
MSTLGGMRAKRAWVFLLAIAFVATACSEEKYEEKVSEGQIDLPDDLYAVTAIGPDHLWAAGYFGAIYRTGDGGKSWRKLNGLTDQSIYDISFADEKNGWAVGRRGFVIHTTDGGDTWELQKIPRQPAQHLFAVRAVDPQTAWAVGDWGGRYYTADGGKTWEDRSFVLTPESPQWKYLSEDELAAAAKGEKIYDDIFLNDVFFADKQHGWMAGEYGYIFRTEDGGQTWERGQIKGTVHFDPVTFPKGEKKIPKDRWDQIFKAAEVLAERPYLKIEIEGFLTADELRAKKDTFIADERAGEVQKFLENEGINQDRIKVKRPTPLDQEGVDMKAFAASKVTAEPTVRIEVIETPFLFDVKFRDSDHGLITGLGGVALTSSDGGRNWEYLQTGSKQALFAGAFADTKLVAVGEKGLRRISLDGGQSWQKLGEEGGVGRFPAEKHGYFRDLTCGTPTVCWMVGQGGNVLRSTDAGQSWYEMLPTPETPPPATGAGE